MKPKLLTLLLILNLMSASVVSAQGPAVSIVDTINASGTIYVDQPASLAAAVKGTRSVSADSESENGDVRHAAAVRTGYRVQVFDDNNPRTARAQAERAHTLVTAQFPRLRSYVSFNSPYWRVKAGDFRTRAEAESVLAQMREAFPQYRSYLRVVRDKINITD